MNTEINFFSPEGLTNTSANYVANLAKEYYQTLESELNNTRFYSTTLKLLGSSESEVIEKASDDIYNIPTDLENIAKCKALIAWLRSAIKEKEALVNKLKKYSLEDWIHDTNHEPLKYPQCETTITEEEYLNSLTVKERNRWLTFEAMAATFGQSIHPDGFLSKARKDLINKNQNPIKTVVSGRDTLIYKYNPEFEGKQIEDIFFELQSAQRKVQAELNGMKNKMEEAIKDDMLNKRLIFEKEIKEYAIKEKEYLNEYQKFICEEQNKIKNLKIVIPNNLTEIYNTINNLGKKD